MSLLYALASRCSTVQFRVLTSNLTIGDEGRRMLLEGNEAFK